MTHQPGVYVPLRALFLVIYKVALQSELLDKLYRIRDFDWPSEFR